MIMQQTRQSGASASGGSQRRGVVATSIGRVASGVLTVLRMLVNIVAVCLLVYMTGAILMQILGRYVFNYSIAWSEESAIFAQVWLVLLGAGIAMRMRQHVGIDVLVARCPVWLQRLAKSASLLLGAWFLLVLIVGSFGLLAIGWIVRSPALEIPMAIPYLAMPVGGAYFLIEFAIATVPEIIDPRAHLTAEPEIGE